jgi:hypothetical protein
MPVKPREECFSTLVRCWEDAIESSSISRISPRVFQLSSWNPGAQSCPSVNLEIESDLRAQQNQWMAINDTKPDRILSRARATPLRACARAGRIHSCISSPLDARTFADEVLVLARDQQCRPIVVGHRAHSWFRGLGRNHLAEQLVRSAKGYAVWVID